MGLWDKLFNSAKDTSESLSPESAKEPISEPKIRYENIPGALDLGWYYSENKQEHQMAKLPEKDRSTHFYVIGASGSGKTKFLEVLIRQDIANGHGFGVIDPHGDFIEDIKGFIACFADEEELRERVVIIDPSDPSFTITFNPLEKLPHVSISEQVNELISAFKKIWSDSWGVRMEDLMRNSLIALGEAELTLVELPFFLTRRLFRNSVLQKITHPIAIEYFTRFDNMTDRGQAPWIEPVMNKINAFFADERIRQMFASSSQSSFSFRDIMDRQKILLVKLDKGKLKDAADLLGALILSKIQMAAFSRTDLPKHKRVPFYLYIDEFQNFASESFSVILSEARKYGLALILAHQTLSQISPELRSLILGNAGIRVYFRVNRQDAQILAKEGFQYSGEWEYKIGELQNLPPRICYVKHKIEGGIIPIQTVEIEPAWEILEMEESEYQKFIKDLPFAGQYLVSRKELISLTGQRAKLIREEVESIASKKKQIKHEEVSKIAYEEQESEISAPFQKIKKAIIQKTAELSSEEKCFLEFISNHPGMFVTKIYSELQLSGYKGDRLKENLIEKEMIIQEETREGQKGRLAKVLALTDKGTSVLKKSPLPGKGGDLHKHLQMMLKEQAEIYGWKAVIEEKIPRSLESVDVGLKRDDMRVAIEISSTSKAEQEIQNVRKCLEAGYDYVLSVCSDDKSLISLKTEFKKSFTVRERERIRVCHFSRAKEHLRDMTPGIVSEKNIVSGQITKQKQLLDTTEASAFLGISRNTLYEWIIQKKIPHVKVGRLVKFKQEDLDAWLKKRTQEEQRDFA